MKNESNTGNSTKAIRKSCNFVLGAALLSTLLFASAAQAQSEFVVPSMATAQSDSAALPTKSGHGRSHIMGPHPADQGKSDANSASASTLSYLQYHGGLIMQTSTVYLIFWEPPTLQDGSQAGVAAGFNNTMYQYVIDVNGSALGRVQTQYSETFTNGQKAYVQDVVGYGGSNVDHTTPYPLGHCWNQVTGYNCIRDDDIYNYIARVMNAKGWSGGFGKIFMLFTSYGEGSCNDWWPSGRCKSTWDGGTTGGAAYADYCGYHSYFTYGGQYVIYANMPYQNSGHGTHCYGLMPTTTPHGDRAVDAELSVMSHEHFEAITDPFLDGWYDIGGEENGDKCAWNFSGGQQVMNGRYYLLQAEFSNSHLRAGLDPCVQHW